MDSENPSQSRPRDIASWPSEISHFMLELLLKQHKSGRTGDKGLRKDRWMAISSAIKERFQMTYEWEQCRNHYRIWKQRVKAMCDLQKNSRLGWNSGEMRFNAALYVWNEFKKKEQRYWKEHKVLPIHLEVAIWLGNEIATGNGATHPSEVANEDVLDNSVPVEGLEDTNAIREEEIQGEESAPSTPIGSSRGRPHSNIPCGRKKRKKRKKDGANKISSPLKSIATAITKLVTNDWRDDLAIRLSTAIDAMPGIDFNKKWRAKQFFMERKNLAALFLNATEEDKPKVLELYMLDSKDIIED